MYTEQDKIQIGRRLRKYGIITAILLGLLIAADVVGMIRRVEVLVMVDGVVLFVVGCFMWLMYLWPCIRYRGFLKDMEKGLSREISGSIVEISQNAEVQDGVRVLPVRVFLEDEQDERIVYLNASKAEQFPKADTQVRLSCFGRHIKEVALA